MPTTMAAMRDLTKKYHMLPMDLAAAELAEVAEGERIRRVFTVDRREFSLYLSSN